MFVCLLINFSLLSWASYSFNHFGLKSYSFLLIILNLCARRGQCSSSTHNVNGPIFGSAPYHYYTLPIQYKMVPFVHFLFGLLFCNFFLAIIHIIAQQYSVGSYGERTELRNFHSFKRLLLLK